MIPVLYQLWPLSKVVLCWHSSKEYKRVVIEAIKTIYRRFLKKATKSQKLVLPAVGMTDSVKLIHYGFHVAVNNTAGSLKQHLFHIKAMYCFTFVLVPTF